MNTKPYLIGFYTLRVSRNRMRLPAVWQSAFYKGETVLLVKEESRVKLIPTAQLHAWLRGGMDLAHSIPQLNRELQEMLVKGPAAQCFAKRWVEDLCALRDQEGTLAFTFARLGLAYGLTLPSWVRECVVENGRLCAVGLMNVLELMSPSEHDRQMQNWTPEKFEQLEKLLGL